MGLHITNIVHHNNIRTPFRQSVKNVFVGAPLAIYRYTIFLSAFITAKYWCACIDTHRNTQYLEHVYFESARIVVKYRIHKYIK